MPASNRATQASHEITYPAAKPLGREPRIFTKAVVLVMKSPSGPVSRFMRSPNSLRVVALVGVLSLISAACPEALFGQARPKPPVKRDTLTAEERAVAREATRDAAKAGSHV